VVRRGVASKGCSTSPGHQPGRLSRHKCEGGPCLAGYIRDATPIERAVVDPADLDIEDDESEPVDNI
jgi:hypothetical protein